MQPFQLSGCLTTPGGYTKNNSLCSFAAAPFLERLRPLIEGFAPTATAAATAVAHSLAVPAASTSSTAAAGAFCGELEVGLGWRSSRHGTGPRLT